MSEHIVVDPIVAASSDEEEDCMEPTIGVKRDHNGKKRRQVEDSTTPITTKTTITKEKYEFHGEIFFFNPTELREHIIQSQLPSNQEVIREVVDKMLSNENLCGMTAVYYPQTIPFYKFLKKPTNNNPFFQIFSEILDNYVDLLVEYLKAKKMSMDAAG